MGKIIKDKDIRKTIIYTRVSTNNQKDDLKNQVASDMKQSYIKNLLPLQRIAVWLNIGLIIFGICLFLITATALFIPKCAKMNLWTTIKSTIYRNSS